MDVNLCSAMTSGVQPFYGQSLFRTMPGEHLCGESNHGCRIRPSEPKSSARLGTAASHLECPTFRRLFKSAKGNCSKETPTRRPRVRVRR